MDTLLCSGKKYLLDHVLLTNHETSDDIDIVTYGIKVCKYNSQGELIDSTTVNSITSKKTLAEKFLSMMITGKVTPYTATDIIEDFLT